MLVIGILLFVAGLTTAALLLFVSDEHMLQELILGLPLSTHLLIAAAVFGAIGLLMVVAGRASKRSVPTEAAAATRAAHAAAAARTLTDSHRAIVPIAAAPNYISNGSFSDWPGGESFEALGPYQPAAAGWLIAFGGDGSTIADISRTSPPIDATPGSSALRVALRDPGTGPGWFGVSQTIGPVTTLAGKTVRVSFEARASTDLAASVDLIQDFDSAETPRREHWGEPKKIGTEWSTLTFEIDLGTVEGKSTGDNASLSLFVSLPTEGAFWIDMANFHLQATST